ncbi:uncharacterized protein LOC120348018 [Styela clava]
MRIPIQYILLMFIEAFPLVKGEKCWMPMVCDGKPTWRNVTTGQCTKEEEKALEALTTKLDGMESNLHQLKKTMEESETNSLTPSVVGVKNTTTPSVVGDKETTTPSVVGVKETTTPSVVGVKETTTPQGYKDKKTSSARISTLPATSPWSSKEAFLSTFRPQTTKVEQSTVDLTCDFESSTNPTCGYTRVNGTFQREYRNNEVTGYVLAGNGTIRSLPKAWAGNDELCMSVDIKGTSDGELVVKAYNGTEMKAIRSFSASTTWKIEKFILTKINSADIEFQLELEASGNVELDNITTLNSSECYGLGKCINFYIVNEKVV